MTDMIALEVRHPITGPFYLDDDPGGMNALSLAVGDLATLRDSSVTILAKVVSIEGANLVGTIFAFDDYDGDQFKGKQEGDEIRFHLDNVFGFTS